MKGLSTLMRLARAEIDARQRALAELEAARGGLERDIVERDAALVRERDAAAGDPETLRAFSAYLGATMAAKADLARRAGVLGEEAGEIRASLNEAFIELKRLELLAERLEREEERAQAMRDNAALDEMAIARFARKA